MASVSAPSAGDVVRITGLNRYIEGTTESDFLAALEEKVTDAEAETALAVGESTFDGSGWTARQVIALKKAIAYRAAAEALGAALLQYATGTQEPLLMDPEAIQAAQDHFRGEAERLEALAQSGTESTAARPFARPSVGASTFTVGSSDRTLSERNELTDERDGISSFDTENG